jgi:hypothetical protein
MLALRLLPAWGCAVATSLRRQPVLVARNAGEARRRLSPPHRHPRGDGQAVVDLDLLSTAAGSDACSPPDPAQAAAALIGNEGSSSSRSLLDQS